MGGGSAQLLVTANSSIGDKAFKSQQSIRVGTLAYPYLLSVLDPRGCQFSRRGTRLLFAFLLFVFHV